MATFPVGKVDQFGVVFDRPPYELPFNAWSAAQNMRFRDGSAEKFLGQSAVFGTPSVPPYRLLNVPTGANLYWIYMGLQKVYVWDGGSHTNITRQTLGVDVNYGATADIGWSADILGGIPILNNGVDPPQMWSPQLPATKLVALTNWPASTTANVIRTFKTYLIALNVTKSGTTYRQMVKWSSSAPAGLVPATWDTTDATNDAGEYNLADSPDACVDGEIMRDLFIIYKEDSVWGMQYIGGTLVFRFFPIFRNTGILSRHCAVEYMDGMHAVFGPDDIYRHDGQTQVSIMNERDRKYLYNNIDATYGDRSYVVHNKNAFEVWFCWPQTGQQLPSQAFVWNYVKNTGGFRDLQSIAHIQEGIIDPGATSDAWNAAVGNWTVETSAWSSLQYNPNLRQLLMAQPGTPALLEADQTSQFAGTNVSSSLERTGLGFPFREGDPPDFVTRKRLSAVWPRITGTVGQVVNIYVATQENTQAAPAWNGPYPYTIGVTQKIDPLLDSRLFGLRFVHADSGTWSLSGYEVEVSKSGRT